MLVDVIECRGTQEIAIYEDEPSGTILYATDGEKEVVISLDDDKLERLIQTLGKRERNHPTSSTVEVP